MAFLKKLYVQVLLGICIGVVWGILFPDSAVVFKPLSDVFIKLVKMLIAPVIFLTLVSGIAAMHDMKAVGRIGGTALCYFMLTTTFALSLGLLAANIFQPGAGLNINPATLDISAAKSYINGTHIATNISDYCLNIIPNTFFSAFVDGEILQVLLIAILFSAGMMLLGEKARPILNGLQLLSRVFFNIIHLVMHLAPVAAFAAMAFSVGKYGTASLLNMLGLLVVFYATCILFVVLVLGVILWAYCRVSIWQLLSYIKTEIFIVLGTSSSETVLPNLMEKLEQIGCEESIVGLVLPVGYSFNLAGTAIYLTLAALFIAQATNIDLTLWQQLSLLAVMIISSKGAAGVSGSGFVVLASSLAATGHIPVAGIILILGIDRFMSDGRAVTNMIGNAIATIIISTWHKSFDFEKARVIMQANESSEVVSVDETETV